MGSEATKGAESLDRAGHRLGGRCFVAGVHDYGQRLPAGGRHRLGRAVDRAGKVAVRFGRLGGDNDIGAVARGA